jgi:hypothetical protein
MSKIFLALVLFIILLPNIQHAFSLDLYCLYGLRTVNNSDLKRVYGNGQVYYPAISADLWHGLSIGVGYEGGYSRDGYIGIYEEFTNLKIMGVEVFAGYQLDLRKMALFARAGYGFYSYKQHIDNPALPYRIDDKKSTIVFAGGLKIFLYRKVFLVTEIKYVPLKVKPVEDIVDLGGIRCLGGIGIRF